MIAAPDDSREKLKLCNLILELPLTIIHSTTLAVQVMIDAVEIYLVRRFRVWDLLSLRHFLSNPSLTRHRTSMQC